jgi:hypothetical protein
MLMQYAAIQSAVLDAEYTAMRRDYFQNLYNSFKKMLICSITAGIQLMVKL